jgi:methylmalonyl-CoA mutase N-terminal domain/subunit
MNTSMTINACAAWLLALYVAVADETGAPRTKRCRHDAERHPEGISLARDLRLPAGTLAQADQGHHPVHHP